MTMRKKRLLFLCSLLIMGCRSLFAQDGLIINEVMASNAGMVMSPAYNFDSWIEIYNPTGQSKTLTGYYLSTDPGNLTRWKMPSTIGTVPAHGFLVLWLGSDDIKTNQAPFHLDCDGGTICLTAPSGELVTSVDYPEAMSRTAWARKTDGGNEWGWTAEPTPAATNVTSHFATERLDPPVVNIGSQLFNGSLTFKVDIPEGTTLRYTIDNSMPDAQDARSADGRFTVTGSTNYVFRLFKDGYLPSVPITRSFIQTSNTYTIPVISIVGDERYFTDSMWGIDVKGSNGKSGLGRDDPVNWNMPWDRPVNMSYITPDEGMVFNQDVNISVSGGWSRASTPRSMKLKSNKVFDGLNHLDYVFFPQKPFIRSKTLLVRNGGNDMGNFHARFTDLALTNILQRSGMDVDVQSYVQVAEYINGRFKGVLNLREPNNDKFVYANYGYDDDEIDMFENGSFSNGTADAYNSLCELATHISEDGVYDEVKRRLDVDEFINYMAVELFLGNDDWPENNAKGFRSQNDGRFRFICFDLDLTFNPWGRESFSSLNTHRSVKMVALFLNLLNNDEFRKQFIDTFCIVAGSVYEKSRAIQIVNELSSALRPMAEYDGYVPDRAANNIKNKLNNRMEEMTNRMQQFKAMQLTGVAKQSVTIASEVEGATLFVNGKQIPYSYFKGRLFQPVQLEAKAPAGYTFAGWQKASGSTIKLFEYDTTWKFYDQGELGANWRTNDFSDASWPSGEAPLGYKMAGVTTTVSYGSDSQRKNPTTYFRKTILLNANPTSADVFQLNYQLDDGCVVWVNGQEAGRVNMTSGTVGYTTFSSTYAGDDPLTGTLEISPTLFKRGYNVIAVEVHNTSYTSGDLFWACELLTSLGAGSKEDMLTDPIIDLPEGNNVTLTACFDPLTEEERRAQGLTPVRINEVSAANDIFVNEYFKRNDWVELYNTTDDDIDVAGMYLSDKPDNPKKYQIVGGEGISTIIPAHGYLIIWCDKLEPQSQLHASFKLAADGDDVLLTAADGSWTDRMTYSSMKGDETVGRYPDGSNQVITMNVPTIAKANITSSYAEIVGQPEQSGISDIALDETIGLSVRYLAHRLVLRSTMPTAVAHVEICNLAGQKLSEHVVNLRDGFAELMLNGLSSGYYLARLSDGNGHQASCKFINRP